MHDLSKERMRIRYLHRIKGWLGKAIRAFNASQAWIIVFIIGALTGLIAAYIDVATEWLTDIREGYCEAGFYLNRKFCCWHENGAQCDEWKWWGGSSPVAEWSARYLVYVATGCTFASVSAYLVAHYGQYAAGSGIAEIKTILGGFVIRQFLGSWTLLIKCIGMILSVASGLSIGVEDPLVHVASCVGNIVLRLFPKYARNEAKKREILSASCAAGVSVGFGAPLGGVLFSLEEVSYYFPYKVMWRSFFCAMIAGISLQLMNPFRTHKLVLYQVSYERNWYIFELPVFVMLGLLGGAWGSYFNKWSLQIAAYRKSSWLFDWPVCDTVAIALLSSSVSYPLKFLRASTVELLTNLFRECEEVETDFHGLCSRDQFSSVIFALFLAALLKTVLTVLTFGARVPGGVFLPAMAIGACVGRGVGMLMQVWQESYPSLWIFSECENDKSCVTPGTYALVGAAAAFAGSTRMTVSLTVIMFELTGALPYVLPIMITVMVAKMVADSFDKDGIFDGIIHLNGYPYLDHREEYTHDTYAGDIMTKVEDLQILTATGHTIDSLDEIHRNEDYKGYPVVNTVQDMQLIGYAGRAELRYALKEAQKRSDITGSVPVYFTDEFAFLDSSTFVDLRPWIDQTPTTLTTRCPIDLVVEMFKQLGLRYVLITKNGRLLGLITKKDLLRHVVQVNHPDMQLRLRTLTR
ncbi:chloride channel [Cladochytrium replicatum]|nr:chloride channel [Cladochytrium replicatum]